jgi:carbon-monoxide dehydrogenase large subunit
VLGIGQALWEQVVFDENGAILTDSYSTYPLVRASQLPDFDLARTETPTPNNPLGAKGAGDVANPAVAPAIVNAVCDAVGVDHIDMPLRPERVWRALEAAER